MRQRRGGCSEGGKAAMDHASKCILIRAACGMCATSDGGVVCVVCCKGLLSVFSEEMGNRKLVPNCIRKTACSQKFAPKTCQKPQVPFQRMLRHSTRGPSIVVQSRVKKNHLLAAIPSPALQCRRHLRALENPLALVCCSVGDGLCSLVLFRCELDLRPLGNGDGQPSCSASRE